MYVRIPQLNAEAFNLEAKISLSSIFLTEKEGSLSVLGLIISALNDSEDGDTAFNSIEDITSGAHTDFESMVDKDQQDPVDFVLDSLRSGNEPEKILEELKDNYAMTKFLDDEGRFDIEKVEDATEMDVSELYPLYCKPSDETISYCLRNMPAIAFIEIEGNYFMHLTTSGSCQNDKIALGYLMVDDYIPHNYISNKKSEYYGLSDEQERMINDFFDTEGKADE